MWYSAFPVTGLMFDNFDFSCAWQLAIITYTVQARVLS